MIWKFQNIRLLSTTKEGGGDVTGGSGQGSGGGGESVVDKDPEIVDKDPWTSGGDNDDEIPF